MKSSKIVLTLAAIASSFLAHAAPAINVSGVNLGATQVQARAAASSANKEFTFVDIKQNDGKVSGFQAKSKTIGGSSIGASSNDFMVVLFDQGSTWFVGRFQKFEEGDRPTTLSTMSALKEKFGPPTVSSSSSIEWQYDRSGALYKGIPAQGPCPNGIDGPSFNAGMMATISVPAKFSERCGFYIEARLLPSPDGRMVNSLLIRAYESGRIFDGLQQQRDNANAANAKKLEEERAKAVKPQL